MSRILFLAHRVPYPPNKGDKIRSHNVLTHLARTHEVHLGAFVDDPADWDRIGPLREVCASCKLVPLRAPTALCRSAFGVLRGESISLPYYRDRILMRWVNELKARELIDSVFVFSSTMAQYARDVGGAPRVLDLCDVDSLKWREYALRRAPPVRWIYRREGRLLAAAERRMASDFDLVSLVSDAEATLFRQLCPEAATRVITLRNGVDTSFFDPQLQFTTPFADEYEAVVFTGAMDYWANVDAVEWFAREVLPLIVKRQPRVRFYIVGSRPTAAVRSLAHLSGVVVTGDVPDVRPYLRHCRVVVAPLRIARGVQNKVLEALAMAQPVVGTPAAFDGFDCERVPGTLAGTDPEHLANVVIELLRGNEGPHLGALGRRYVREEYSWSVNLRRLDEVFASAVPPSVQATSAA